jgi:hypothetical protein
MAMHNLSTKQTVLIAAILSLTLWATRGQHIASLLSLPDASWAIAFFLGFLFSPVVFLIILAQAFVIDYLAMGNQILNISYVALIPAYFSLWFSGKWLRAQYEKQGYQLSHFAISFVGGVALCELISSGAFYFQKSTATFAGFAELFGQFFFSNLFFSFCYVAVMAISYFVLIGSRSKKLA